MNKWISVEERLPEVFVDVLIWDGTKYRVAYLGHYNTWLCESHYGLDDNICEGQTNATHWMPLPTSPKENK